MTARTRHLGRPDTFLTTEAATEVLCGTEPKQGTTLWATEDETKVTCKKCVKVMVEIEAEAAAEAQAIDADIIALQLSVAPATAKWERDVATRHGLEEATVFNAVSAGWLKR